MAGLIEVLIVFGALLAYLVWELVSVNRALRRDRERKSSALRGDDTNASAAPVSVERDTASPRD